MSKHDDYYTKFAIYGNNDSLETLKKRLCSTFVGSFGNPASVFFPSEMIDVDKNSIIDLQIINDTLMVNIESPTSAARIAMQRIIEKHFKGELKYVMLSEEKDGPYINTDTTGKYFPYKIYVDFLYGNAICKRLVKNEAEALEVINKKYKNVYSYQDSFVNLDEVYDLIAHTSPPTETHLILESFVDADGDPLWRYTYPTAYKGKMYRVMNGMNCFDVVGYDDIYRNGEKLEEISSIPLQEAVKKKKGIEIFEKCSDGYGYSHVAFPSVGDISMTFLNDDHFEINYREIPEDVLRIGFLYNLVSYNLTFNYKFSKYETIKPFAKHNELFGRDRYVDGDSPVFLVSEYEMLLFLSNTLNADRIYFSIV